MLKIKYFCVSLMLHGVLQVPVQSNLMPKFVDFPLKVPLKLNQDVVSFTIQLELNQIKFRVRGRANRKLMQLCLPLLLVENHYVRSYLCEDIISSIQILNLLTFIIHTELMNIMRTESLCFLAVMEEKKNCPHII